MPANEAWSIGRRQNKNLNRRRKLTSFLVLQKAQQNTYYKMSASDERYAFLAEWYDPQAALMRKYQLLYYPSDSTVEMYDIKNRRLFLKRSLIDGLRTPDLYRGAIVNIHSRQLTITDFADNFTTTRLKSINEQTLALIKPDALGAGHLGSIIEMIDKEGFVICKAKMVRLTRQEASDFYKEHADQPFYDRLVEFITSGPVVAMELKGHDAIQRWRKLLGPTDSATAREKSPISVRAKFGTDNAKNAAHGSDSADSSDRELKFFFGYKRQNTAQLNNCTLCIIKPHAVAEGLTGKIISAILDQGFEVSALQMFHMERANAEEFHEVYKGVVFEYNSMVVELCSGPCLVLEIRGLDVPQKFREFVGPADPEIARHLRPQTIRARFGQDKIKNAVHCTDLPEDGILEVQYFFKILNQ